MQNTDRSRDIVHVAVAVLINNKNQILISKRPEGVHLGGCWEFPGGKVNAGEAVADALRREIKEELDIELLQYRPLIKVTHHYKDKSVLLDVWRVTEYSGVAIGNEGQLIDWKSPVDFEIKHFPEADIAIIQAIKLPDSCMITGRFDSVADYMQRLESAINRGVRLVQCRITADDMQAHSLVDVKAVIENADAYCKKKGVSMILNTPDEIKINPSSNIHLTSSKLMACTERPQCGLLSASCHNAAELQKAVDMTVDFAFLSPVKPTSSHPGTTPIGWDTFNQLINNINIPVYALGGVGEKDLGDAWQAGAQGIAGIGCFWK